MSWTVDGAIVSDTFDAGDVVSDASEEGVDRFFFFLVVAGVALRKTSSCWVR